MASAFLTTSLPQAEATSRSNKHKHRTFTGEGAGGSASHSHRPKMSHACVMHLRPQGDLATAVCMVVASPWLDRPKSDVPSLSLPLAFSTTNSSETLVN